MVSLPSLPSPVRRDPIGGWGEGILTQLSSWTLRGLLRRLESTGVAGMGRLVLGERVGWDGGQALRMIWSNRTLQQLKRPLGPQI